MTQHTELIERLRASSEDGLTPDDAYAAVDALEAQAREIAGLREALQKANAGGAYFGLAPIKPSVPDVERSIPKFHFGSVEDALKNVPRKKGQP